MHMRDFFEKQAETKRKKDVKSKHSPDISTDIFFSYLCYKTKLITECSYKYNFYVPYYLLFFLSFAHSYLLLLTLSLKERAFETKSPEFSN